MQPSKNHGREDVDEDVDETGKHASDHRSGQRLHDFSSRLRAPDYWQKTGDYGRDSHDLWAKSEQGAFLHGFK